MTHGDVQAWLSELSDRGLAGASVRKAQGVLSGILGLAVRDRRLAVNPALGVALPPMQEKRRRYLTAEQLEALADAAGPGRVAVLVLGYCGLRWSELAALRVRHFDLLRRRVLVEEAVTEVDGSRLVWGTPKTHGRRSVPLPRFLVDELARTVVTRPADELAFPSPQGAVLRNRNARSAWFDAAARAIGEPGLHAARTPAHRGLAGDQGGGQRQGGAADARARLGGHDPGPLRRPVRRRPETTWPTGWTPCGPRPADELRTFAD